MEVVLGGFDGEDDVFNEVPVSDAFVDEVAAAAGTGIQPTALHNIDGLGLLPPSTLVTLLPSCRSRLVGVGLVPGGLGAFDTTSLTVGWTDGTRLPLSKLGFQSRNPICLSRDQSILLLDLLEEDGIQLLRTHESILPERPD